MMLEDETGRANQKKRTRTAIVEAAREIIRSGSPLTMPEVARAALVSEATAYRYFPDLPALLSQAFPGLWPTPAEALGPVADSADPVERIAYAYRYLYTSSALEELTAMLLQLCGGDFRQVIYSGSGSEAMESALKIALQYFAARGLMKKRHFIARDRSWHGNTLGVLSLSGFAQRRRAFEGSLLNVSFVSAANTYRPPAGVGSEGLVPYLSAELERRILEVGPETVAAFVFEPIVGAAGGVVPAPEGYARAIQAVCRKYDVLLIADEVMCGSGRCGTFRALEHDGIVPDIMAIAKGLCGGYIPLGATL